MGCAFVVRPGQERRGLADTLTLFPRQSTRCALSWSSSTKKKFRLVV